MATPQPGTVEETGASFGDILEGTEEHNQKLCVKIFADQEKGHGGRIKGNIKVIDAGTGKYSEFLQPLVGSEPRSAAEIIEVVQKQAWTATHFLNANTLRVRKDSGGESNG